ERADAAVPGVVPREARTLRHRLHRRLVQRAAIDRAGVRLRAGVEATDAAARPSLDRHRQNPVHALRPLRSRRICFSPTVVVDQMTRVGAPMPLPKLTKLEMQVMDVLWDRGPSAVREIQEAFPEKGRPAYTTVQTIVYRLEAKKALRRVKKIGNAHVFEA